jgi:hypothetical protein
MAAVPSSMRTTITTVVASGQDVTDEQRARLCDWLRANGIDPFLVVQGSQLGPSVGGIAIIQPGGQGLGYVQFHQYDRHPDGGSKYADPQTGEPAFYERRIWLSVALPPEPVAEEESG